MDIDKSNCLNCEQPLENDSKFCPNCGQKNKEELTVGVLFYNTISDYFAFDARFPKSFVPLMFRPGYLAKRFVAGKRLLYLHPAKMYLFISVIFFFVFSFTVNDLISGAETINKEIADSQNTGQIDNDTKKMVDSLVLDVLKNPIQFNKDSIYFDTKKEKVFDSIINRLSSNDYNTNIDIGITKKRLDSLRIIGATDEIIMKEMGMDDNAGAMERGWYTTLLEFADGKGLGKIIKRFADIIPIAMFFLLPLFALILKVFYFRRGRYAYHLVFSFYFFSYLFTVFTLIFAINRFITEIPVPTSILIVLSTFIYFYLSLINFYKRNWFTTLLKSGIITFVFLMMVIPLAFVLIGAFAVLNV